MSPFDNTRHKALLSGKYLKDTMAESSVEEGESSTCVIQEVIEVTCEGRAGGQSGSDLPSRRTKTYPSLLESRDAEHLQVYASSRIRFIFCQQI